MSDTLEALARPTTLCAFCPKMCRTACPTADAEAREAVTPWAKMSLVHLARTGKATLTSKGALDALESCTGCGACVEKCAHGNPVAETLFSARAATSSPRAAKHRAQFLATGDVKGRDHRTAIEGFARKRDARFAYFPGCARAGHDGRAAVERDLRALGEAFGEEVAVVDIAPSYAGGAQCCGYPLYVDGELEAVEANFDRLADIMGGHEVVVTPDPGCAHMLSTVREVLIGRRGRAHSFPSVVPVVEALAQHAERFRGRSAGLVVKVHDPCYLGRRGRSFDASRKLLQEATGLVPLEFSEHHDDSHCSGAGGLYPVSKPSASREVARQTVERDGNAHIPFAAIATACPSARRNFTRAGATAVDVIDVILGEVGKVKP